MKAIIMAGGEGTRLRPLTLDMPKPLAKLCNRPTVEYILDLLDKCGCDEAVFTLHYKGEMIENHFGAHQYKNIKLDFSYEDSPLGTAGCVKKAAENFHEDFIVISGDALCDFDLADAFAHHKKTGAAATILTKQVNDPREYGLVIEDGGKITGFSEKPSYLSCVSDYANTGIYILNHSVLELIPADTQYDFARDVFPKMIAEGLPLYSYCSDGYWCDIGDLNTYRESQFEMLDGNVECELHGQRISRGFYSLSPVPQSATIIPPCFIGENVTIGENSIIENTVINSNVTIGAGSRIFGSVLLDGVYVANDCVIDSAVLCENVRLCHHVKLSEYCVVGANTVIGEKSDILPSVKIWDNKQIDPHSRITRDLKRSNISRIGMDESGIVGETNVDITTEYAALIGSSVSALARHGVLVACDKNNCAKALKSALISGISAAGSTTIDCGTVPLPVLIYMSRIMNADIIVYINAKTKSCVTILNENGLNLTRQQERILEAGLHRKEYKTSDWKSFGKIKTVKGAEELYTYALSTISDFKSHYNIFFNCTNKKILSYAKDVFEKISTKAGETLVITLDEDGNKVEFNLTMGAKNIKVDHDRLMLLATADRLKNGEDVALPADFPVAADYLANSLGRGIYRFFSCSNDSSDQKAREISKDEPFLKDGIYLALLVLKWITKENTTLEAAVKALPSFKRESRLIKINTPPQRILSRLCESGSGAGEGIMLHRTDGKILLRSNKRGNSLFIHAESASAETSSSLCDEVEQLIKQCEGGTNTN